MLSRRNIRIKVMQILYSMSRDPELTVSKALVTFRENVNSSYELFLFNLYVLIQVAGFAKEDAKRKLTKLLPSDEDKSFRPVLSDNALILSLSEHRFLQAYFRTKLFQERIDQDILRKLYINFAKLDTYKTYARQKEWQETEHRQNILDLYKSMTSSELFEDLVEDHFPSWIDDRSLIVGSVKKTIKALPAEEDFHEDYRPSDETSKDFGEVLLRRVNTEDQELLDIIEPTLKNWDADRVAVIDMILLKMAICELTSFPTIPTKVTLNEFVEISKLYSTDKSKDFINGILDRLLKKLNQEGKINKEGRGLME